MGKGYLRGLRSLKSCLKQLLLEAEGGFEKEKNGEREVRSGNVVSSKRKLQG